jgi:hypothetical protein
MATKQDFTETEWATLQKGITGSGMLVSLSDRDFTDSFGEASAMGKYLSGQQLTGATDLMRELAKVRGTGFGLTTPPDRLRNETIAAVTASVELLTAKSPDDVEPYRGLVLGLAAAVADAKSGTSAIETAAIEQIKAALGAA